MKELRHVMIDLETMGTTPDSAIVSIGAVIFDPRYGVINMPGFYVELDWDEQGRGVCPKTQEWWNQQSEEVRSALDGIDELRPILRDLAKWLPKDCKVWANGPTFDISMLEDAYEQFSMYIPWKFWNIRDCRTILDMYESKRGGTNRAMVRENLHNALSDAIFQAEQVNKMWSKLLGDR
jgi:hypothetical protein